MPKSSSRPFPLPVSGNLADKWVFCWSKAARAWFFTTWLIRCFKTLTFGAGDATLKVSFSLKSNLTSSCKSKAREILLRLAVTSKPWRSLFWNCFRLWLYSVVLRSSLAEEWLSEGGVIKFVLPPLLFTLVVVDWPLAEMFIPLAELSGE